MVATKPSMKKSAWEWFPAESHQEKHSWFQEKHSWFIRSKLKSNSNSNSHHPIP
jgi:hypothetical protein